MKKNFIDEWFNEDNRVGSIKRGPTLTYEHGVYHVDFEIIHKNNKKQLVEIKATHVHFYEELRNGNLKNKFDAAVKFSKENNYLPFVFILNYIKMYSLYEIKKHVKQKYKQFLENRRKIKKDE